MISCLAATSMPRVGSSRISRRGSVASQRASIAFCWLPPESRPIGVSTLAVLMPSALTKRSASAVCSARDSVLRTPQARLQRQRDVLAQRQLGHDAVGLALFGAQREAVLHRIGRAREIDRDAVDAQRAAVRASRGRTAGAPVRCGRSRASPASPTISPARTLQVDRLQLPALAQAFGLQHARRAVVDRRQAAAWPRRLRRELAPDHRRDQRLRAQLAGRATRRPRRRCAAP